MNLCTACTRWECLPEDLFCGLCGNPLRRLEIIPQAVTFVGGDRAKPKKLSLRNSSLVPLRVRVGQPRATREWLRITHPDAERKRVGWTKMVAAVEDGKILPHPHTDAEILLPSGTEYSMELSVEGRLAIPERDLAGWILLAGDGLIDASGAPVPVRRVALTWGVTPDPRVVAPGEVVCRLGAQPTTFDVRLANPKRGFVTLREPPRPAVDWIRVRDYPLDPVGPGQEGVVALACDPTWAPQGSHKVELSMVTHELDKPISTTIPVLVRQPPILLINRTHVGFGELTPFSQASNPLVLENRGEEDLVLLGEPIVDPPALRRNVFVRDEDPSHRRIKSARDGHRGKVVHLAVNARGLAPGEYEGTVKVASNDASPETGEVRFSFAVKELPKCNKLLALDFGTSNCCIAVADNPCEYRVLDLSGGGRSPVREIPTVVYFKGPGEFVIGEEAKNTERASPDRTISSIKRRISSTRPQKILGQEYTPTQIASIIIRQLWERAAVALQSAPSEMVVTVPCQFGKAAIDNLLQACRDAGFSPHAQPRLILDEPSAAAYRYIILNRDEMLARGTDHRLAVYDFGGGTLDFALLDVKLGTSPATHIRVLDVDGIDLGGDDLDDELLNLYLERMRNDQTGNPKSKLARIDLDRVATLVEGEADLDALSNRTLLRRAAEDVKKTLSTADQAPFPSVALKDRLSQTIYLDASDTFLTVKRSEFEQRIKPRLDEAAGVIAKLLERAKVRPDQIGTLLLTGGSSQIPLVRAAVGALFPKAYVPSPKEIPPKESVALGAVIHGYLNSYEMSTFAQGAPSVVIEPMRDRAQFSIGTLSDLGEFREIVPRGALPLWGEYPIVVPPRVVNFRLVRNNGTTNRLFMEKWQFVEIGTIRIDPALFPGVPPGRPMKLNLWFREDRSLEVTVPCPGSTEKKLEIKLAEGALQ